MNLFYLKTLSVTDSRVISLPTALTDQKGIIIELKAQLAYHTIYITPVTCPITRAPDIKQESDD